MFNKLLLILLLFCSVLLHAQTHSLVIGINNGNLIGAENARAMVDLLQKKQINISYQLIGNSATSKKIVNAFKLSPMQNQTTGSTFFSLVTEQALLTQPLETTKCSNKNSEEQERY